ncbi:MAG: AAA family ATPase [Candidatus Bathyarchaeota archaeon]
MIKAIVFNGLICAGKTTLAKHLCNEYGWDRISFGDYISHIADKNKSSKSRKSLQDIGYDLYNKYSCYVFLKNVIDYHNPSSDVHIYDSIRHPDLLFEVKNYYSKTTSFYLNLSECKRYERYVKKYNDGKTFDQFKEINNHPVEKDILRLLAYSDHQIDETLQIKEIINKVKLILKKEKYL